MKTTVKNYLKSIHFKIMNDKMSRTEAVVFALILIGASIMMLQIGDHLTKRP